MESERRTGSFFASGANPMGDGSPVTVADSCPAVRDHFAVDPDSFRLNPHDIPSDREHNLPTGRTCVNLREARLTVPIVSVVIGEGMSGGVLGIGVTDRILMLERAIYSVISPEGARPSYGAPRRTRTTPRERIQAMAHGAWG